MRDASGQGSRAYNHARGWLASLNEAFTPELDPNTVKLEFNLPVGPAGIRSAARLTSKQAADLATWPGYTKRGKTAPFYPMGQAVFTNGRDFITLDLTMHSGVNATWKLFSQHGQRLGTFNFDLSILIGK